MPGFFTCRNCGKTTPRNPRLKKQRYCSSPICQNTRKRLHDKKIGGTAKGKLLQKARNKRWRDKAPAHSYQDQYRKSHPGYEDRNREQQKLRNKRRRKDAGSMIVKTDALLLQPRHDGAYMAFKVKRQKIVKTDTLLLQMQSQPGLEAYFP
jgi:hypothetical protein